MSKNIPSAGQLMPSPQTFLGGGRGDKNRRAGAGLGMMFGVPAPMMAATDQWQRKASGGQGPAFLNPADWFNGKLEGELTGDTSQDARSSLAKYGLFAAPWMPAMFNESMKKGDKIKEHNAIEAKRMANLARFSDVQPFVRGSVGGNYGNPFGGGQFNAYGNQFGGPFNQMANNLFSPQMQGLL